MSVRRNRISANKQYIRVWFDYVKVALQLKMKIDRSFYRKWHLDSFLDVKDKNGKVIRKGVKFNDWWKDHEHLFTIKKYHTIRIDTSLSMKDALKQAKEKLEGNIDKSSEFQISSDRFRYVEVDDYLKVYKKRLKGDTHLVIAYDIEEAYQKKDEKYKDNKNLLKRKMQRVGHEIKSDEKNVIRKSIRRVNKAKTILNNVAKGVFPGQY